MAPQAQALEEDHHQNSPPVPVSAQFAFCTCDSRMIRNLNFNNPKPSCHRLTCQLSFNLESLSVKIYGFAKASVKHTITGQQIRSARSDQDSKCCSDRQIPKPTCQAHRTSSRHRPARTDGHVSSIDQKWADQ